MNTLIVLFGKISDEIERYVVSEPLRNLFYLVVKMIVVLCLTAVATFPAESWHAFYSGFSYSNFFAPKFAFFWLLTYKVWPYVSKRVYGVPSSPLIEGIPIDEIVDHVFSESSFKRDEIERKFALPRNRYQAIANKLDEFGVFVRGDNNARVLRPGLKREDLVIALYGSKVESGPPTGVEPLPRPSVCGFIIRKLQTSLLDRTKPDLQVSANDLETQ